MRSGKIQENVKEIYSGIVGTQIYFLLNVQIWGDLLFNINLCQWYVTTADNIDCTNYSGFSIIIL